MSEENVEVVREAWFEAPPGGGGWSIPTPR